MTDLGMQGVYPLGYVGPNKRIDTFPHKKDANLTTSNK